VYQALTQPVGMISGIGPALEKRLRARGVEVLGDLLLHVPRDYVDDRTVTPIARLTEGDPVRIQGRIVDRSARGYGRKKQVVIRLADESGGMIELKFFHSGYMMTDARLAEGQSITVRGTAERWGRKWQMTHPEWMVPGRFRPGWRPVYGALAGLSGKRMAGLIEKAVALLPVGAKSPLDAALPAYPSLREALCRIHQGGETSPLADANQAWERLRLEELLVYLHLMQEKRRQAAVAAPALSDNTLCEQLVARLPYALTEAQHQVWGEISADLASGRRMHRLLQGDVGAGKTWIAALCIARTAAHGMQAALMAPTEVLAAQHAETLRELLSPIGLDVTLLTGSTKPAERKRILKGLAQGDIGVVVGTHALISDDVCYGRLGLVIVDEQHRFGVRQRWALAERGAGEEGAVHLLAMTATPIPRTLALAMYGDMDLSVMHGMPPGRKPVETRVIRADRMAELAAGMRRILDDAGRIYWIVPRIDEEEDGVSVGQRVEALAAKFPDAGVRGLHGRMKAAEKQQALDAFAAGECRILVSTTVIEVGVNVAQARLIVIEHAENYGLAQLHQLRGRVGRSHEQGYCILLPGKDAPDAAIKRLKCVAGSHDGMALAEMDMASRGAGDAVGTRQSGEAGFRIVDMVRDAALIRQWHGHLPAFTPSEAMIRFWRPCSDSVD